MSDPFRKFNDRIYEGDLVLAYLSRTSIVPLIVESGKVMNNRFGSYPHSSMIGMEYGSQMTSSTNRGFIFLLHPTPELWTLALPHRTQILYAPDISYILAKLRVTLGTSVIEAGTGSGSFTHSFIRAVGSSGKVYTYEFHKVRCLTAAAEFEKHGLMESDGKKVLKITHRDVCKLGFGLDESFGAGAVFLDLPAPWEAIPHLSDHLESTTRLCCFSPCIEQVQRTVITLRTEGWLELECFEIAAREWESRYVQIKDISEVLEKLRAIKKRRVDGAPREPNVNNRILEGQEGYKWQEVAKAGSEIKSHTSFLVFAIKHR